MAYSFQTFPTSSVFTSAQANQIEVNIRDHVHGADGVGPVGLSWIRESKSAGFTVQGADAGKIFDCAGDFTVDFDSAATLGDGFAASIKNVGSGRVALKPFGTQLIDTTSYFVVTPLEAINVYSDAANLLTFGHTKGWFILQDFNYTSSIANVVFDKIFGDDFNGYMIELSNINITSTTLLALRVSIDSGSTFQTTGYANDGTAASHAVILAQNISSATGLLYSSVIFPKINSAKPTAFQATQTFGTPGTLIVTHTEDDGTWFPNSAAINAIQIIPTSGALTSISAKLWGLR